MSGGPIYPFSGPYPGRAGGNAFPNWYSTISTGQMQTIEGIGVVASLGANAICDFAIKLPPSIPTGTAKIVIDSIANANTGNCAFIIADAVVGANSNIATTLTAETQAVTYWGIGEGNDVDKLKQNKVTISSTPLAGNTLVGTITFVYNIWTMAQVSTHQIYLIWE